MGPDELAELASRLERRAGAVQCVFCEAPGELPLLAESIAEAASPPFTVVSILGAPGSTLESHIEQALDSLAQAVLVQFPGLARTAAARLHPIDGEAAINPPEDAPARLPRSWWTRVLAACQAKRLPRCPDHPALVEAERLALCLDPQRLVIVWLAPPGALLGPQLLGLARAAEWLASCTRSTVVLSLDRALFGRAELDSVSYDPLQWPRDVEAPPGGREAQPPAPPALTSIASKQRGSNTVQGRPPSQGEPPTRELPAREQPNEAPAREQQVGALPARELPLSPATSVPHLAPARGLEPQRAGIAGLWPVIGQPHPLSPAELLFANALAADAELAPEFRWNQPVDTAANTRPIVDLLSRERKLAVEIDGFAHHASRAAFERDRQRDWELMISGYRVLRLAASEILADTPRSLEKLRTLTRSLARGAT